MSPATAALNPDGADGFGEAFDDSSRLSEEEVRLAVQDTLDSLPEWVAKELGEVVVLVEEADPQGSMGVFDTYGGIPKIIVFREANPSRDEVRKTVLHEIGHYFGMNEQQIQDLGYG